MNRTPVYIVCSPRPRVGKTLVSRLLAEYLDLENRYTTAFDINLNDPSLLDYLPKLTETASIDDTFGQMQLMDRLIANDGAPKVVDLGFHAFDGFFKMADGDRLRQGSRTARRAAGRSCSLPIATAPRNAPGRCCRTSSAVPALVPVNNEQVLLGEIPPWIGPAERARHRGSSRLPEDLYRAQQLLVHAVPEDVDR